DACDHLLDDDGLADACTAEEADLATADEGAEQVDDLDACFEHFGAWVELGEGWGLTMDGHALGGVDGPTVINGLAGEVEDASEDGFTHGNGNGRAGVEDRHAAAKAVGGAQGDGADLSAAEMLLHFADEGLLFA